MTEKWATVVPNWHWHSFLAKWRAIWETEWTACQSERCPSVESPPWQAEDSAETILWRGLPEDARSGKAL